MTTLKNICITVFAGIIAAHAASLMMDNVYAIALCSSAFAGLTFSYVDSYNIESQPK